MDDTISRQAAIDVVRKCSVKEVTPAYMLINKAEVMTELMMLPSAQPEIVRCKDCKYVGTDATCCLVCNRDGMGLRPFHVYHDDFCSYAKRRTE